MLSLKNRVERLPQENPAVTQAFYYQVMQSTNADAMGRGKIGALGGTLIVADKQTAGRGRLGRGWESPPGKGLYFSWLLRPNLPVRFAPLITLAVGLGIGNALRAFGLNNLTVKWPNDLIVEKKKLGGILTEMMQKGGELDFVVVGVGINIEQEAEDFSPAIAGIAGSLKQVTGKIYDRGEVLAALLPAIHGEVQALVEKGPKVLQERWEKESGMVGQEVAATWNGKEVRGKVLGLAEDGQLRLETSGGEVIQLLAEDTTLL